MTGTSDVAFAIAAEEPSLRAFVAKVLQRFRYFSRPKGQRGLLFEYMQPGDALPLRDVEVSRILQ